MKTIQHFLLIFILFYGISNNLVWSIKISFSDNSQEMFQFPFPSSSRAKQSKDSCRHCFVFYTMNRQNQMIVEPCGGNNCVPIINNTHLDEYHQPTQKYDLNKCGLVKKDPVFKKGTLQVKISTSIKNTLRADEYPWLVRIENSSPIESRTVTLCGGTLIHPQWIITAAHCMFDSKQGRPFAPNRINIFMGHYDRVRTNKKEYIKQPALYVIHPKFRISRMSPAPIHDLALLKLARPAPLSSSINIACLPEKGDKLKDGKLAFTAGWGHSSTSSTAVNKPRKARIRISPGACQDFTIDKKLHICGRNKHGNNICSGDSGTGLMIRAGVNLNNTQTEWKWHLFGVASFGLDECSPDVNHDNAFASVSADLDWIHQVMATY